MVPLVVGNLRRMEVMWCFPPYDPPPHCASAAPTRPKSATIKHMCTMSKVKTQTCSRSNKSIHE